MAWICKTAIYILVLNCFVCGSDNEQIRSNELADNELVEHELATDIEKTKTESDKTKPQLLTGVISEWRNGIVPICLSKFYKDPVIKVRITSAIQAIEAASCVKFKIIEENDDGSADGKSCIHITNPTHERECIHYPARGKLGELMAILGYDCMDRKNIIHMLMHVLGFKDEVTHPNRDSHVRILWDNIQPKYRHLFVIPNISSMHHNLTEYDTLSIMHFHDHAYSINGEPTIVPMNPDQIINPSDDLSVLDKMKLRLAFQHECNKRKVDDLLANCKNYMDTGDDDIESIESVDQASDNEASGEVIDLSKNDNDKDIKSIESVDQASDNDA